MKNRKQIYFIISLLLMSWTFSLEAVELLTIRADGSKLFRCDGDAATHRVSVKFLGKGKYLVLRASGGSAGFSGVVYTNDSGRAALKGCKR